MSGASLDFRPFTIDDWAQFPGATHFLSGSTPLISYEAIIGSSPAVVILDGNGITVHVDGFEWTLSTPYPLTPRETRIKQWSLFFAEPRTSGNLRRAGFTSA